MNGLEIVIVATVSTLVYVNQGIFIVPVYGVFV